LLFREGRVVLDLAHQHLFVSLQRNVFRAVMHIAGKIKENVTHDLRHLVHEFEIKELLLRDVVVL